MNEHSAGAIICRKEDGGKKFLVLHYNAKEPYWDFPRGNIKTGETEIETASREIEEETGINKIEFYTGFKEQVSWFYNRNEKTIHKYVTYFLAQTPEHRITISKEHIGYAWLSYENAIKRLNYANSQEVLKKAQLFLKNQE